jgi:hypothetical protein
MAYLNFQKMTIKGCGSYLSSNNYDLVWYNFKEFMRTAGWTVPQSGDGISVFKQDGTQAITQAGNGANGMANARSWYVLQEPTSWNGHQRQFLFTHVWNSFSNPYDAAYMNILYSVQGFQTTGSTSGFNNAACSATNPAQAFDGTLIGSSIVNSYNVSPVTTWTTAPVQAVYNQYFPTTTVMTGVSQDVNVVFCASSTAPYFWYILGYSPAAIVESSAVPVFFICYDPLGSFDTGDQDPVMIHSLAYNTGLDMGNNFTNLHANNTYRQGCTRSCWYKWNLAGANQATVSAAISAGTSLFLQSGMMPAMTAYNITSNTANTNNVTLGTSPYAPSNKPTTPALYFYASASLANFYIKGTSSYLKTPLTSTAPWQTLTVSSSGDYLSIPDGSYSGLAQHSARVLLPWDGTNPSY